MVICFGVRSDKSRSSNLFCYTCDTASGVAGSDEVFGGKMTPEQATQLIHLVDHIDWLLCFILGATITIMLLVGMKR